MRYHEVFARPFPRLTTLAWKQKLSILFLVRDFPRHRFFMPHTFISVTPILRIPFVPAMLEALSSELGNLTIADFYEFRCSLLTAAHCIEIYRSNPVCQAAL
jgi:hypothetical protein